MAKQVQRLSMKSVAKITREAKPGRYLDGDGLLLQVTPSGVASWLFRYRGQDKKEHFMGFGPQRLVTLAKAREKALAAREQILDGVDPLANKRAERSANVLQSSKMQTFEESTRQYLEANRAGWKAAKHAAQWEQSMIDHVLPTLGKLAVAKIDVALVLRVLEPIWQTKTETAARIRGRIEAVLDAAKVRGYRTGDNPARWKGHLDHLLPKVSKVHQVEGRAALPYNELAGFMGELASQEGVAARALAFLVLTAARTGEVIGAKWSEVDMAARMWTIPGSRMKAGKEHRVPLSDAALEILKALPREQGNDHVFVGGAGQGLGVKVIRRVLERMRSQEVATVHGFRSAFSTWAHERTAHSNHTIEISLAHAVGNKVEQAYRRGDMFEHRVRLMQDWARFATTPVASGANVVSLRATA